MSDDPFDPDFNISRYRTRYDDTGTPDPDDPFSLLEDYSQSETAPPSSPSSSAPDLYRSALDSDPELVDSEQGRASSPLSDYQLPESSYHDSINNVDCNSTSASHSSPAPSAALDTGSLLLPSDSKFKSTPVKATLSSVNPHAIQPLKGKTRGPPLIGATGMAPRWHLLSEEKLIGDIPGALPTSDQRSRFVAYENLDDVTNEWQIYPKVSEIGNSVFREASCTDLRLLITANHKDKIGTKSKFDIYNDGGVYRTTKAANNATALSLTHRKKITNHLALELIDSGYYGRTSFHHVAVPIEIKYDFAFSAFTFSSPSETKQKAASTAPHPHVDDADSTHDGEVVVDGADLPPISAEDQPAGSGVQNAEFHTTQVPEFIHCSVKGQIGLSQLGEYMFKTFKYQHRIFSFAIYIYRDMCRLLRFDHSGAFVSTPFRWTSRDSALHSFLWKIARMSDSDRLAALGYDPTATPASDEDCATFAALQSKLSLPQEVRDYVGQATANNAPVYKVQVTTSPPTDDERLPVFPTSKPTSKDGPRGPDTPDYQTYSFLIGDPLFAAEALVGRCTKGYVAYRLDGNISDEDRLCFLKDCWRPYVAGRTRPEHLVYQRLHSHSVKFIASLVCGGDVGGPHSQITTVQDYLSDDPHLRPVPRVHYRVVTQEVGIPVTEFKTFQELAKVFANVLRAHGMAWSEARILHRDISVGNIMINPKNRKGFLIDWDLSRFEPELGNGPVEPDRSGTWQYRSALLLQFPRKPCRPSDDIESFVHAFRQLVLRFSETSVTKTLGDHVRAYYEQSFWQSGVMMGGESKLTQFKTGQPPFQVRGDNLLNTLMQELAQGCFSFYNQFSFDRMQKVYGIEMEVETEIGDHNIHVAGDRKAETVQDESDPDSDSEAQFLIKRRVAAFHSKVASLHQAEQHAQAAETTDPCAIDGFLSSHAELYSLLKAFATSPGPLSPRPKGRDNFAFLRSSTRAGQSTTPSSLSRTGTVTLEYIAGYSGSPIFTNRRFESLRLPTPSSGESSNSRPHSRTRKRARQDEVEEALDSVAHRGAVGEASASRSRSRHRSKQAKND